MDFALFLRIFEHLLPRARAWQLKINIALRRFFDGLVQLPDDAREFINLPFVTIDPQETDELDAWEEQWGLSSTPQTEQERRDRIEAQWSAVGGQSPRYLQDTIQASGFPTVFVHEAFVAQPQVPPVASVIRNPNLYINDGSPVYLASCGDTDAFCGEPPAQLGNTSTPPGYLLVNRLESAAAAFTITCGETLAECGEALAQLGQFSGIVFTRFQYTIPVNPAEWASILYYGGETFPDQADVPASRRDEFENLIRKLSPGQQWLGVLVNYT